jgi:hypothetical protein
MKFIESHPLGDPDAAARKLVELEGTLTVMTNKSLMSKA